MQAGFETLQKWPEKWLQEFNPPKYKVITIGTVERRPVQQNRIKRRLKFFNQKRRAQGVDIIPNLIPEAHISRITAEYYILANVRVVISNLNKELSGTYTYKL